MCVCVCVNKCYVNITCPLILVQVDRISDTGDAADVRDSTLYAHTCFLIKSMCRREEHIRDIAVNLLTQLRDRFPQVMSYW